MRPFIYLIVLAFITVFASGCMQFVSGDFDGRLRSATDQDLLSRAVDKSFSQLELSANRDKLASLKGKKVSVSVSVAPSRGSEDATASFLEDAIIHRLLLLRAKVVNDSSVKPEYRLVVTAKTLGIDSSITAFPHFYYALYFHNRKVARVNLSIYAYNTNDFLPELDLELKEEIKSSSYRLLWVLKW